MILFLLYYCYNIIWSESTLCQIAYQIVPQAKFHSSISNFKSISTSEQCYYEIIVIVLIVIELSFVRMHIKNSVCGQTLTVSGVWGMHVVECDVALSLSSTFTSAQIALQCPMKEWVRERRITPYRLTKKENSETGNQISVNTTQNVCK